MLKRDLVILLRREKGRRTYPYIHTTTYGWTYGIRQSPSHKLGVVSYSLAVIHTDGAIESSKHPVCTQLLVSEVD